MCVLAADVVEMSVLVEVAHRVAAQERKRLRACQLIPQHFETDCCFSLLGSPENVHHLAVYSNAAIRSPAARPLYDFTHAVREPVDIRLAVRHESGQCALRV